MRGRTFLLKLADKIERSRTYDQYDSKYCVFGMAKTLAGDADPGDHIDGDENLDKILGGRASDFHSAVCATDDWPKRYRIAFEDADIKMRGRAAMRRAAAARVRRYARTGE